MSRVVADVDVLHGVRVADPYRWLEDGASPAVRAWADAQDRLARGFLHALPGRDALAARLKQLYYLDVLGPPLHRGGRYFYTRRRADQEKAVLYWKEGEGGAEKVLLDPNPGPNGWSTDGSVSLGGWSVSWDGKSIAYQVTRNGEDAATLHVRDVATGAESPADTIDGARYASAAWTPDGRGFYYVGLPVDPKIPADDLPGYAEVRFHALGRDPKKDALVRAHGGDPTSLPDVELSRDGRWLLVTISHGWTGSDVYYRDLRAGGRAGFTPLVRSADAEYTVSIWKDRFYVLTNEGAPRGRLFRVDPARPERAAWREIVPEMPDALLEGAQVLGGRLALTYLRDATSRLDLRELDGEFVREVALPAPGTIGGPVGNEDDDEAYFSFDSYVRPLEIDALSMRTGETRPYFTLDCPVDLSSYAVDEVRAPSTGGAQVTLFVVHRKDLARDGRAAAWLTGYGGFDVPITPEFDPKIVPWLERGGVFAEAILRGDGDFGETEHRAGMRHEKQHAFDDFLAAAEYLVREGYTSRARLVIEGASNGGLLMGAALTQRPDLFRAVICGVPLLDMLRYPLFGAGKTWIDEYGDPADPADFAALYAYSPYHHVRKGARYPAVLLLSADSDDRVDPMHARKLAAELQADSAGGPVLLRIERHAGHGGAHLLRETVARWADALAFAMDEVGLR